MQDLINRALRHAVEQNQNGHQVACVHVEPERVRIETHMPTPERCHYRYVQLDRITDYVGDHVVCSIRSNFGTMPPVRVQVGQDWDAALSTVTDSARAFGVPVLMPRCHTQSRREWETQE